MFIYNATCIRVVDGDTIDATIDLGFDVWKKIRIRFIGINTPESRTRDLEEKARGLAAKEFVREMLEKHENKFIFHSHGVGKFGRALGEIYLGEANLNKMLIEEGHAVEYYGGKR
jgi:micrococcal nuclease|tara:strand:- start:32 stop:376 length:345 start_codon:yes stop_codon:yes gene_type:complete